jgi:hypothetical protein
VITEIPLDKNREKGFLIARTLLGKEEEFVKKAP